MGDANSCVCVCAAQPLETFDNIKVIAKLMPSRKFTLKSDFKAAIPYALWKCVHWNLVFFLPMFIQTNTFNLKPY